eukprot:TRINITY_DN2228_c0_g1_i1.p2 TRINITY_DN2228_c0_g1~~TRINITY_DN2228_c0_g1_i1.p2  ORF type:complete len:194 (+),score=-15.41 TRINITY_DN2228_c0_g1_i1:1041-1622(+)
MIKVYNLQNSFYFFISHCILQRMYYNMAHKVKCCLLTRIKEFFSFRVCIIIFLIFAYFNFLAQGVSCCSIYINFSWKKYLFMIVYYNFFNNAFFCLFEAQNRKKIFKSWGSYGKSCSNILIVLINSCSLSLVFGQIGRTCIDEGDDGCNDGNLFHYLFIECVERCLLKYVAQCVLGLYFICGMKGRSWLLLLK